MEVEISYMLESRYYIRRNENDLYKVKACDSSILILTNHVTLRRSLISPEKCATMRTGIFPFVTS